MTDASLQAFQLGCTCHNNGETTMKILFTTDGSPCSDTAFEQLLNDQSLPADCEFKVLSVVEAVVGAYSLTEFYVDSMVEAEEAIKKERVKIVDKHVALLREKFPAAKVEGSVAVGYPAERILAQAAKWNADLIVLGSHGRHGFSHFIMGSVAERVARDADCSVEIIRIPQLATEKAAAKNMAASAKK
jgi:nucleotide-binding universal stress UspA family protein